MKALAGGKHTMKAVTWHPTSYGVLVGLVVATREPCKTDDDYVFADECRTALRRVRGNFKEGLDALMKRDPMNDATWDEDFKVFDEACDVTICVSVGAFNWLREKIKAQNDGACYAGARIRLKRTLENAHEGDVDVAAQSA